MDPGETSVGSTAPRGLGNHGGAKAIGMEAVPFVHLGLMHFLRRQLCHMCSFCFYMRTAE